MSWGRLRAVTGRDSFKRARRAAVAALAAAVLLGSPLQLVPANAPIRDYPVLKQVRAFSRALGLTQYWKMFAPPGKTTSGVGAAFRFDDGWTDVVMLQGFVNERGPWQMTAKRGHMRLHNHLRSHASADRADVEMADSRKLYYESLGLFYCQGIGRIPGLREMRFYQVRDGIAPFHAVDSKGNPSPEASDLDSRRALYDMPCEAPPETDQP